MNTRPLRAGWRLLPAFALLLDLGCCPTCPTPKAPVAEGAKGIFFRVVPAAPGLTPDTRAGLITRPEHWPPAAAPANDCTSEHPTRVFEDVELAKAQGGDAIVKLTTTLAARFSKTLVQVAQERLDLLMEFVNDPDPAFSLLLSRHWPFVDPPPGPHGFTSPAWSDRNGRERLGLLAAHLPTAADLRLLLVGHSHCPGISMTEVGGRFVPLVDVGSWIQGKSQVAIAEEGQVTIFTVA